MIRVAVIDDHPLLREGVVAALNATDAIHVIGTGSSAHDAVSLAQKHDLDVIVLDIYMPGGGFNAANRIRSNSNPPRIVMLTASGDFSDLRQALTSGALGYVAKGDSATELTSCIEEVAEGNFYVSPQLLAKAAGSGYFAARSLDDFINQALASAPEFTPREGQILDLLASGKSNQDIADECSVSLSTVKSYVTKIFEKLQVKNRVEAAETWRTFYHARELQKIKNT